MNFKIIFLSFVFCNFITNIPVDPFNYYGYKIPLITTIDQLDLILNIPDKLAIVISYLDNSSIIFKSIIQYQRAFQIINTSLINFYRIHTLKGISSLFLSKQLPAIFSYYNGTPSLPPLTGYKSTMEIVKYISDAYYHVTGLKLSLNHNKKSVLNNNIINNIEDFILETRIKS